MDIKKKEKHNNYMLMIFNQSTNEEDFVKPTATELTVIANTDKVKYYLDDSISMYTFETEEMPEQLEGYLSDMFKDLQIHHLLIKYDENNVNINLPSELSKCLFNEHEDKVDIYTENISLQENIEFNEKLKNIQGLFMKIDDEDDDGELSINQIRLNRKKSIDEILDKVIDYGINSITEEEKEILNNYSNR